MGPFPDEGDEDPNLINAANKPSTPGATFFSTTDSFGMIRGGHVDLTVLGAMKVRTGDMANWIIPAKWSKAWAVPWTWWPERAHNHRWNTLQEGAEDP